MVDVHEREFEEIKSSELLAWLLWPSGYWEEWAAFQWGCLILGFLRVWGFPHWSPCRGCWLAVELWLLFCCWLILPAIFLLQTQNVVCILQGGRFFFLQGMILVGNRSCLIQSIANVIIKCSLISILIWWGDNCFFFKKLGFVFWKYSDQCYLETILQPTLNSHWLEGPLWSVVCFWHKLINMEIAKFLWK